MTETDELREQLRVVTDKLVVVTAELTNRRLVVLEANDVDHEKRIRSVEEVATKFNFVMALSIGGGSLSALVLIKTLIGI